MIERSIVVSAIITESQSIEHEFRGVPTECDVRNMRKVYDTALLAELNTLNYCGGYTNYYVNSSHYYYIMHNSGKRFSDNCVKSDVVMDDVLTGVIIDGVLGIDMNVTDEFKSQMDGIISGSSIRIKEMAQVLLIMILG